MMYVADEYYKKRFPVNNTKQLGKYEVRNIPVGWIASGNFRYDTFHIIVEQGNYCRLNKERVTKDWRNLMGFHSILLDNYEYLSEVILSVIRVNEGEDAEDVANSWQDVGIRKTVRHALFD